MKPTTGITLPASFVVTVSHAGTEALPTEPADNDILTVAEVTEMQKCKPSSIYNLTEAEAKRGAAIRFQFFVCRWACGSVGHPSSLG
jgi:hypothetical protein